MSKNLRDYLLTLDQRFMDDRELTEKVTTKLIELTQYTKHNYFVVCEDNLIPESGSASYDYLQSKITELLEEAFEQSEALSESDDSIFDQCGNLAYSIADILNHLVIGNIERLSTALRIYRDIGEFEVESM